MAARFTRFGESLLQLAREALIFSHDSEQVPAPESFDLLFAVAAANQLQRNIERFAGIVPSNHAAAAIEIRGDPDVIDAEQIYGIIDMIDKVVERCRQVARIAFIQVSEFALVFLPPLSGPCF